MAVNYRCRQSICKGLQYGLKDTTPYELRIYQVQPAFLQVVTEMPLPSMVGCSAATRRASQSSSECPTPRNTCGHQLVQASQRRPVWDSSRKPKADRCEASLRNPCDC